MYCVCVCVYIVCVGVSLHTTIYAQTLNDISVRNSSITCHFAHYHHYFVRSYIQWTSVLNTKCEHWAHIIIFIVSLNDLTICFVCFACHIYIYVNLSFIKCSRCTLLLSLLQFSHSSHFQAWNSQNFPTFQWIAKSEQCNGLSCMFASSLHNWRTHTKFYVNISVSHRNAIQWHSSDVLNTFASQQCQSVRSVQCSSGVPYFRQYRFVHTINTVAVSYGFVGPLIHVDVEHSECSLQRSTQPF